MVIKTTINDKWAEKQWERLKWINSFSFEGIVKRSRRGEEERRSETDCTQSTVKKLWNPDSILGLKTFHIRISTVTVQSLFNQQPLLTIWKRFGQKYRSCWEVICHHSSQLWYRLSWYDCLSGPRGRHKLLSVSWQWTVTERREAAGLHCQGHESEQVTDWWLWIKHFPFKSVSKCWVLS